MQQLCYHCMKPRNGASVCPYCKHSALSPNITAPYHLKPGTVLHSRYLVGEVLGEGGFGVTYIGLDQTLSKRVAIKEFFPSGAANRISDTSGSVVISRSKDAFYRKGVSRFLEEAQNVAAFSSEDGIVDVLDFFEENNTAYIVMEYLEGETLKEYVSRRGTFAPNELITRLQPVMQALSAMHRKGVIHRDISPDNIMLTKSGKLVLMDFGSARYFTNRERDISVVIKAGFAPEEQYRHGSRQGPYTDVYALCATIYYCITGTLPVESLDRAKNDTLQPPSRLGVAISPAQEAALMHGLAVDATRRCPDMDTLMRTLNDPHTRTVAADNPHTVIPPVQGSYRKPEYNANYHDDYSRRVPPRQQPPGYYAGGYAQPPVYPPKKKSNAPIIAAIIVTTVAILAVGGVIIYLLLSKNAEPNPTGDGNNDTIVITKQSSQESSDVDYSSEWVDHPTPPPESSSYSSVPLVTPPDAKARLNEITAMFSEDNPHMSEARDGGDYDYVAQSNGRIWVGTKGSFYDDENEKTWYLFDSNHKLYFVYKNAPESEYRYYVYQDTVFKYTVGPTGDQANYMLPDDAVMQTDTVQGIVAEAYNALGNVSY